MKVIIADKDTKQHLLDTEDNLVYVVARNGCFKLVNNAIFRAVQNVSAEEWKAVTQGTVPEIDTFCFHSLPQLQKEEYTQALSFFQEVYQKHSAEACILLTLRRGSTEGQRYGLRVPKQKVSGGAVDYKDGLQEVYNELEQDEYLVGSIHTHPGFSAYDSGTDKDDEACFDGIHWTFGHIKQKKNIEVHQRLYFNGVKYTIENCLCPTFQLDKAGEYPAEWMERVSPLVYAGYGVGRSFARVGRKIEDLIKSIPLIVFNEGAKNGEINEFLPIETE